MGLSPRLDFSLDVGDITVLVISLVVTTAAGLYYGNSGKDDKPESSYLGARKMSIVPITLSLIASHTSSFVVLVLPAEVIGYGTAVTFSNLATVALGAWVSIYALVPVVYNLDIHLLFDYFELRFDKKVKYLSSLTFILAAVTMTAISGMLPGVILHQFTGIDSTLCSIGLVIISTIATTYGGFSGVVWIDALQCSVMYVSLLILVISSMAKAGGWSEVFRVASDGGRLNTNFLVLDPTARVSLWTYFSFTIFSVITIGGYPAMFQRIKALPTLRDAQKSCMWTYLGWNVYVLGILLGLAAYTYYDCDLTVPKIATSHIDTVVIFINEIGKDIISFRGWFLAVVVCSTVSTESAYVNTVGAMIYLDLVKPFFQISDKYSVYVIRFTNVFAGLACLAFIWIFRESHALYELNYSFISVSVGAIAAQFCLGLFAVNCNSTGALYGGVISYIITFALSVTNRWYVQSGEIPADPFLDPRVEGCPANMTHILHARQEESNVSAIFRISPFCYILLSTTLTVALSLIISGATGGNSTRRPLSKKLFSTWVHRFLEDSRDDDNQTEMKTVMLPKKTCNQGITA